MTNHTATAKGLKIRAKNIIVQEIVNVGDKIASLDPTVPSQMSQIVQLDKTTQQLIAELKRLIHAKFQNLNSQSGIAGTISGLNAATKAAKTEAEKLKNTAENIEKFNAMLEKISGLVGNLVGLAI